MKSRQQSRSRQMKSCRDRDPGPGRIFAGIPAWPGSRSSLGYASMDQIQRIQSSASKLRLAKSFHLSILAPYPSCRYYLIFWITPDPVIQNIEVYLVFRQSDEGARIFIVFFSKTALTESAVRSTHKCFPFGLPLYLGKFCWVLIC